MSLFEEPHLEPQPEPEKPKKKKLLSIGIGAALIVAVLVTSVAAAFPLSRHFAISRSLKRRKDACL